MNEQSKTTLPGANITPKHVEGGVEPLTIEQEAIRANLEAMKQSTNQKTDQRITSND
jgi:hypothetical protein